MKCNCLPKINSNDRHKEGSKVRELRGIHGTTAEIMNVDSCSLYEFRITAVSRYGASKPIYLVQYTGIYDINCLKQLI